MSLSARLSVCNITMLRFFSALMLCLAVAASWAQGYQPKPGETVLEVAIEGRGNVYILLYTKEAPKATQHIIDLAKGGFYNGQKFFRVVRDPRPFLVQVGDPQSKTMDLDDPAMGSGGSGSKIPFENSGFSNDEGSVGLSTLPKEPNSGDSQFYILLAPSKFLDGKYTVFGKVVKGMDVVQRIQRGDRVQSATILKK